MARSNGLGKSLKTVIGALAGAALLIAFMLYVNIEIKNNVAQDYAKSHNITIDQVPAEVTEGFDTVTSILELILGALGVLAVVLVFMGLVLPVVQKTTGV